MKENEPKIKAGHLFEFFEISNIESLEAVLNNFDSNIFEHFQDNLFQRKKAGNKAQVYFKPSGKK